MRRIHLFHGVLFLLTYVVCLFYYWRIEPRSFMADKTAAVLHREITAARKIATRTLSQTQQSVSEQAGIRIATAQSHQERAVAATPVVATSEWSDATQRQVSALSAQAISAEAPTERGKAIIKLGYIEKTPQAVQALADVLNSDQSEQNRVLAVASLLDMVRQGDEDGLAKTALTRALSDQDPRVAARARRALESLSNAPIAAE
jgi:hypothetical protein